MTDTTSANAVQRVGKAERIANLDVLRGFAILAILMMNIPYMGTYIADGASDMRNVSWTAGDIFAYRAISTFFDGTQRGLLELLFGAGIMIMTRAALKPDGPVAVADLHFRRNIWLIIFGIFQAVALMWPGDILMPYGVVAIFAFPTRTLAPRWKAIIGVAFILVAITPSVNRYFERIDQRDTAAAVQAKVAAHQPVTKDEQAKADKWKERVEGFAPLAQSKKKQEAVAKEKATRLGPIAGYAKFLRDFWIDFNFSPGGIIGLAEMLGTMMLGMALYDWGVLQGRRSAVFYLGLLVVGYGVGAPLRWWAENQVLMFTPTPKVGRMTWDIARIALTLGHVGLINLALKSAAGGRVLSVFQAPGRMPLTVYLSASIICMLILFPGFGFGLFGQYGWGGLTVIALSVMAGQLVFANVWMRSFVTGPIDWVWKSLAYRKAQPFCKAPSPGAVLQPAE
jgi:uncharacterized protein